MFGKKLKIKKNCISNLPDGSSQDFQAYYKYHVEVLTNLLNHQLTLTKVNVKAFKRKKENKKKNKYNSNLQMICRRICYLCNIRICKCNFFFVIIFFAIIFSFFECTTSDTRYAVNLSTTLYM